MAFWAQAGGRGRRFDCVVPEMSGSLLVALAATGLLAGLLIGCVGVGGVIVVPVLVYGLGIPIQTAIAAAMMGYILTGVIGTIVYGRKGSIRWELVLWLCLGATPAALLGALASNIADPRLLEFGVGALALCSGVYNLRSVPPVGGTAGRTSRTSLVVIGVIVGVLSAMTGTGGPLVLVPILMWRRVPVLVAIGLSQAVQLPIAVLATVGNVAYGTLDVRMGILLGLGLLAGTWGGAHMAHAMPRSALERLASFMLLGIGALILVRLGYQQIS